jgi:hypothetical protein
MRHTMGRLGCARTAWVGTQSTGQARTSATATPARPRTLRSAQRQRRQAARKCSPCHGPAHRRMRAVACTGKELKTYFGRGGEDAMHFCPVRRSAGAAPSDAAGAAAVAGSSAPVWWGCDQSARWRRIRRARGEQGEGTGATASLLERFAPATSGTVRVCNLKAPLPHARRQPPECD